jgi:hypothetical protein
VYWRGCVFATNYDANYFDNNYGLGRQFPGLKLEHENGNDVLIIFAFHESGSMMGKILQDVFQKMDEQGITKHGKDENGVNYMPAMIFDGHRSRLEMDFVSYITDKSHEWKCILGVPYGTSVWQLHDDKWQNGTFKMALSKAKSNFYKRKVLHGLPVEVLHCKIVVVTCDAIDGSFMNIGNTQKALSHRGMNPFNRNTLMHPDILLTAAPEDIHNQTTKMFQKQGITEIDGNPVLPPTKADLSQTGAGLFGQSGPRSHCRNTSFSEP